MKLKVAFLALMLFSLWGCKQSERAEELYGLPGTWMLRKMTFPIGYTRFYPLNKQHVCLIIDKDTTFYNCRFHYTEAGVVVLAGAVGKSDIKPDGEKEYLLFENGAKRPLTIINDTTIMIQRHGIQYTWIRNTQMSESLVREICAIVSHAAEHPDDDFLQYAISTSERELQTINYRLLGSLVLLLLVLVSGAIYTYRVQQRKKHIERHLSQIKEELSLRPQQVAQAMQDVMDEFFVSDYYLLLKQKTSKGKVLTLQEWGELEKHVKTVFPNFTHHLYTLSQLSITEWRVCLLIKLRFTPTEVAETLSKELSTISSIRSRLYKKVFDKSGSSKDWDDFIHSL